MSTDVEQQLFPNADSHGIALFVRTENCSSMNSIINSTKSVESVDLGSFSMNPARNPKHTKLEKLITYLTSMPDQATEGFDEAINEFSTLTASVLESFKDPLLKRIFRSYGWTGKRFQVVDKLFEREKLLQAVSNLYLKYEYQNGASMDNVLENEEINQIEKLAAFAPDMVVDRLRSSPHLLEDSLQAHTFPVKGACMLIDISGFSKYSASMCSRGAAGLDELRKTTSGMLGKLVKAVYEHEGDVIAFAGDALICVFQDYVDVFADDEVFEDNLKAIDSCFRALHCADLLRELKVFDLSTHIGISKGEMTLAFLGGHNGSWTYLINGPCITQLSSCIDDASPLHVVVTKEVYHHLDTLVSLERTSFGKRYPRVDMTSIGSNGNYHFESIAGSNTLDTQLNTAGRIAFISKLSQTKMRNEPIESPSHSRKIIRTPTGKVIVQKTPGMPPRLSLDGGGLGRLGRKVSMRIAGTVYQSGDFKQNSMDSGDNDRQGATSLNLTEPLSTFVPKPVLVALRAESNHQIGELRTVTTLFLSVDSYDPIANRDPASLQSFFLIAQQVLQVTGGFMRQFLIDDKGCVLILMWGVPLYTYANNCSRAIFSAYNICTRSLREAGHRCSVGITTGNVFCGTIGAAERSDYVGIGNEVNLAARFMAKAKGHILVDRATFDNLNEDNRHLLEQQEEALVLKGMPEPIRPYRYVAEQAPILTLTDSKAMTQNKLLKRKIMQELEKRLDILGDSLTASMTVPKDLRPSLVRTSATRSAHKKSGFGRMSNAHFTIVAGPAGSGKKTAADYFLISARERGLQTIQIVPKSQHRSIPYGVMRDLFIELVGEHKLKEPAAQRRFIDSLLDEAFPDEPENKALAKITMQSVLGINDFSNTNVSARSHRDQTTSPDLRVSVYGAFDDLDDFDDNFSPLQKAGSSIRESGDLSFYRVLSVLLRGTPTAIVIEDAQYCDELSWNELFLFLTGFELDVCVLLTIKSKPSSGSHKRGISSELVSRSSDLQSPRFNMHHLHNSHSSDNHVVSMPAISASEEHSPLLPNPSSSSGLSTLGLERAGLAEYATGMFPLIFNHPNCRLLEMKGLSEEEVKALLLQTLKIDSISPDFLRLVMDVSSGNTYWVKNIANLMKELDPHEIAEKMANSAAQGALKSLIVCRLDLLDPDARIIAKYASVVGFEFTGKMLDAVVPGRAPSSITIVPQLSRGNSSHERRAETRRTLSSIFEELEKDGFVYCVVEGPEPIYAFQNELLQKTLYEMILPSDAALIHMAIAAFIEDEYCDNLRPYYPSLAFHFRAGGNRVKAFKYEIKAAALAITSGAYGDGYLFSDSALALVDSLAQVQVLLEVIDRALSLLEPFSAPAMLRTLSSNYASFVMRPPSINPSSSFFVSSVGQSADEEEQDELDAAAPYAENRIATEQHTLRMFTRLKARASALERQLEEQQIKEEDPTLGINLELERDSLRNGQTALMAASPTRASMSRRQLSWQPSFAIRGASSATSVSQIDNKNIYSSENTHNSSTSSNSIRAEKSSQIQTAAEVDVHRKGCQCIIQ